jgi:hypothetical protein
MSRRLATVIGSALALGAGLASSQASTSATTSSGGRERGASIARRTKALQRPSRARRSALRSGTGRLTPFRLRVGEAWWRRAGCDALCASPISHRGAGAEVGPVRGKRGSPSGDGVRLPNSGRRSGLARGRDPLPSRLMTVRRGVFRAAGSCGKGQYARSLGRTRADASVALSPAASTDRPRSFYLESAYRPVLRRLGSRSPTCCQPSSSPPRRYAASASRVASLKGVG